MAVKNGNLSGKVCALRMYFAFGGGAERARKFSNRDCIVAPLGSLALS